MKIDWLRGYPAAALACLTVLVIAPAGAVYWFMNEAAGAQAEAARRSVLQAYRAQLGLLSDRLESTWLDRRDALNLTAADSLPHQRASALGADAVILFGPTMYPKLGLPLSSVKPAALTFDDSQGVRATLLEFEFRQLSDAAALWGTIADSAGKDATRAALAARNQIRCLVRLSQNAAALAAIAKWFYSGPTAKQRDATGRLIAADELLLALQLLPTSHPQRGAITKRLTDLLASSDAMPAPQRLFVMDAARRIDPALPLFPGYQSERLAVRYAESIAQPPTASAGLERTPLPDLWQLISKDGRTAALYRTETVATLGETLIQQANSDKASRFELRPGPASGDLSVALGPVLQGWRLTLLLDQNPLLTAASETRQRYLFLGSLVLAAMAAAALVGGRLLNRQLRLARLKTDLTAAVSHELRTPLASTRLLLENLLAESNPNPSTTREYAELLTGENERLRRLVDNFLTFSRIDRNKQSFRFEPLHPAELATAAVSALGAEAQSTIALDVAPNLPQIRGDQDALQTVFRNLLDNALKFSPADKKISLRVFRSDDGSVAFAVSDNGIGIAPGEQRKIFRKFYQVDQRLARERGGCGLGLSIVEYLVSAHRGEVSLQSAPGTGSTFEVRIPQWKAA